MADTTYLGILKAAATALAVSTLTTDAGTTITKPSGLTVSRTRAKVKEGALEAVVVPTDQPMQIDAESAGFGRLQHDGGVDVVLFANGDPPEDALDETVRWVVAAISDTYSATTKRFLTYALYVAPQSVEYDGERGSELEARAVVRFRVLWHTAADDPALGY
jgi:hypothetical protein